LLSLTITPFCHYAQRYLRDAKKRVFQQPAKGINVKVEGLGPRTHRFQSLGHDPVLGFIFGVKDILRGTFTSIDTNGHLISQNVEIKDPTILGMNLFEALARVFGHMKSDIGTPGNLPVPLMPLFNILQFGSFGEKVIQLVQFRGLCIEMVIILTTAVR
jgi:hypothetical protein